MNIRDIIAIRFRSQEGRFGPGQVGFGLADVFGACDPSCLQFR